MKKWLILSLTLFLVILAGSTVIYINATKPIRAAEKQAIEIVEQETNLSNFSDFQLYNGEETYYVMLGENQKKESVYILVSEKNKNVIVKRVNSGINKEEAIEKVKAERKPMEIIRTRLGVARIHETKRLAWEIYYRSENENFNYYFVDFETGKKLRTIDNF